MAKKFLTRRLLQPRFIGLLWPFVLSHVWLVTHSVDHFPYRMGVPCINPISKGYIPVTLLLRPDEDMRVQNATAVLRITIPMGIVPNGRRHF